MNMNKKLTALLTAALMSMSLFTGCVSSPPDININGDETTVSLTKMSTNSVTAPETEIVYDNNGYSDENDDHNGTFDTPNADTNFVIEINDPILSTAQTSAEVTTTTPAPLVNLQNTTTQAPANPTTPTTAKTAATTPQATTAKPTSPSAAVVLSVNITNSWVENGSPTSQIDAEIKNNSDKIMSGWTVTLSMGSQAKLQQLWNGKGNIEKGVLTVTPESYNTDIEPGKSVTFGMIVSNPGTIDAKKSAVAIGGTKENSTNNQNNNNGNNVTPTAGNADANITAPKRKATDIPPPTTDDWLFTDGSKIVDASGREVWLTGVSWFGYNTGLNIVGGVWTADLDSSIASIADHGFNILRLPFSVELIKNWSEGVYPQANFNQATNAYLLDMNSLEIFDYIVEQCRGNGLKIMIDIHSAATDAMGHMDADWNSGNLTEKDFLAALSWMSARYKNDDTIIAYDLKNEPHGKANEVPRIKWDNSSDPDNWRYIAEKAANAVLSKNPNALVLVEGIEIYPKNIEDDPHFTSTNPGDYYSAWWGGNLRGVKDNPVNLGKYQNKLVYSPHDYGPSVYAQDWFKGDYTYSSVMSDYWRDSWFYIHESNTAPLLIGEWGGFMTEPNLKWMTLMRKLIKDNRLHHTFWCYNADSGDTGGLVGYDYTTWDNEKYNFVKDVLWQEGGKFVSLDHAIPLGANGISLSEVN
jgi:aryl-phospho-beta-D-glucosidase BglC (GH1 family)